MTLQRQLAEKLDRLTGDYVSAKTLATVAITGLVTASLMQLVSFKRQTKRTRELRKEMTRHINEERSLFPHDSRGRKSHSPAEPILRVTQKEGGLTVMDKEHSLKPWIPLSDVEEELLREQLARNYAFLGDEGMKRLRCSSVVVVGLGGVGGHAAHILLRSGVMRLRLIDFDQVTLSSLNRHSLANQGDVGLPKAIVLKQKFEEIFPWAQVEAVTDAFSLQMAPQLLSSANPPSFVLDCIDNIDTKLELIKYCKDNDIPIVSSMGSGAKLDPSRVQIADISDTFEDPLARAVRVKLRLHGIHGGVPVVYSTEKPGNVKLLPLESSKVEEAQEFSALDGFRVRILPVLAPIPAMFGMAMASFVISHISGFNIRPLPIKGRQRVYDRVWSDLCILENRHTDVPTPSELTVNQDDAAYLFEEVFGGKSFLSHKQEKVVLVRFNNDMPLNFDNVICLTKTEYQKHVKVRGSDLEKTYGKDLVGRLRERLKSEVAFLQHRTVPPILNFKAF